MVLPDFSFITTWGATTAYENELRVCGYALGGVTATKTGDATVAISGITAAQGLLMPSVRSAISSASLSGAHPTRPVRTTRSP